MYPTRASSSSSGVGAGVIRTISVNDRVLFYYS